MVEFCEFTTDAPLTHLLGVENGGCVHSMAFIGIGLHDLSSETSAASPTACLPPLAHGIPA